MQDYIFNELSLIKFNYFQDIETYHLDCFLSYIDKLNFDLKIQKNFYWFNTRISKWDITLYSSFIYCFMDVYNRTVIKENINDNKDKKTIKPEESKIEQLKIFHYLHNQNKILNQFINDFKKENTKLSSLIEKPIEFKLIFDYFPFSIQYFEIIFLYDVLLNDKLKPEEINLFPNLILFLKDYHKRLFNKNVNK